MAIDDSGLTKSHARKLNALRKSVGDKLGEEVFSKWLAQQMKASAARRADPVAEKIVQALAGYAGDRNFRLGNYGYTVKRARGNPLQPLGLILRFHCGHLARKKTGPNIGPIIMLPHSYGLSRLDRISRSMTE